jgi:hypothetical protein
MLAAAFLVNCSSCLHDSNAGENFRCYHQLLGRGQLGQSTPVLCKLSSHLINCTVFQPDNPTLGFRHDAWPSGFTVKVQRLPRSA